MYIAKKWLVGAAGVALLGGVAFGMKLSPIASASAATNEATCTLEIKGMTCASCGVAVKTALKRVDGFRSAKVSVKDGKAVVGYDPSKTGPEALAAAVSKIGYSATPEADSSKTDGESSANE